MFSVRTQIIMSVILLGAGVLWVVFGPTGENEAPDVPTEAVHESKVVYTTDLSVDTEPLRNDCRERGGRFETCGNACAPDAAACASVCALVCDLR